MPELSERALPGTGLWGRRDRATRGAKGGGRRPARVPWGGTRAGVLAAPLLALSVLTGACGVAASASPHAIPARQVPFGLLNPAAGPTTTSSMPPAGARRGHPSLVPTVVYLVGAKQHLVATSAYLPRPLTVREVIDQLLSSPSKDQSLSGLTTAVSDHAKLRSSRVRNGVVNLDFSLQAATVIGGQQALAIAQIVWTATAVPGVKAVTISLQGKAIELPVGSGTLVSRPVTRSDYANFAP